MMVNGDLSLHQYLVLFLGIVLSSELLLRLPLRKIYLRLTKLLSRIFKTLRSSRISDHWKELVILHYAKMLIVYALALPLLFILPVFPIGLCLWLVTDNIDQMLALTVDPGILLWITGVSLIYIFLRTRRSV